MSQHNITINLSDLLAALNIIFGQLGMPDITLSDPDLSVFFKVQAVAPPSQNLSSTDTATPLAIESLREELSSLKKAMQLMAEDISLNQDQQVLHEPKISKERDTSAKAADSREKQRKDYDSEISQDLREEMASLKKVVQLIAEDISLIQAQQVLHEPKMSEERDTGAKADDSREKHRKDYDSEIYQELREEISSLKKAMQLMAEDISLIQAQQVSHESTLSKDGGSTAEATDSHEKQRKSSGSEIFQELREEMSSVKKAVELMSKKFNKLQAQQALHEPKMSEERDTDANASDSSEKHREDYDSEIYQELREEISSLKKAMQLMAEDISLIQAQQVLHEPAVSKDGRLTAKATDSHKEQSVTEIREAFNQLRAQMATKISSLEEEMKKLKALCEERTSENYLQDQLENLRGLLEETMVPFTSQLSSSTQEKVGQDERDLAVHNEKELSLLLQHYEQLQGTVNSLIEQQTGIAEVNTHNVELINDVQEAILQLKADCATLQQNSTQVDSEKELCNKLFHELLNKVTVQENDWHRVIERMSTEMEYKVDRMELDSVKKQLEVTWKNVKKNLQAQEAPECTDAAGLRRALIDRFNCLSCDRRVTKQTAAPHLIKQPYNPGFPSRSSIKPFIVYSLENIRQFYRCLKPRTMPNNPAVTSSSGRNVQKYRTEYMTISRSCGGSQTVTCSAQQDTGLGCMKKHAKAQAGSSSQTGGVCTGTAEHVYKHFTASIQYIKPTLRHRKLHLSSFVPGQSNLRPTPLPPISNTSMLKASDCLDIKKIVKGQGDSNGITEGSKLKDTPLPPLSNTSKLKSSACVDSKGTFKGHVASVGSAEGSSSRHFPLPPISKIHHLRSSS